MRCIDGKDASVNWLQPTKGIFNGRGSQKPVRVITPRFYQGRQPLHRRRRSAFETVMAGDCWRNFEFSVAELSKQISII
jgi:hypothetical protein